MNLNKSGPHRPADGTAQATSTTCQHNALAPGLRAEAERFEWGTRVERERAAFERFYHNRLPWHVRAWLRERVPGWGARVIRNRLALLERVAP